MLPSMKVSLIFLLLIFRGRIPSRKTRISIPISLIPPKVIGLVLELVSEPVFEPESSPIDPVLELELSPTKPAKIE